MRGKVVEMLGLPLKDGITPAHAGKRPGGHGKRKSGGDHPRPCGEKTFCIGKSLSTVGSPPPMRGKDYTFLGRSAGAGITPAHAGKS